MSEQAQYRERVRRGDENQIMECRPKLLQTGCTESSVAILTAAFADPDQQFTRSATQTQQRRKARRRGCVIGFSRAKLVQARSRQSALQSLIDSLGTHRQRLGSILFQATASH